MRLCLPRRSIATFALLLCICGLSAARADDGRAAVRDRESLPAGRGVREPAHYLALLTAGAGLRLLRNPELEQQRLAPAFADGFAGYLFSGRAGLGHGFGLGLCTNLASDGGFAEPVSAAEQWTLAPSYLAYWDPHPDLLLVAHLGPVFQLSGSGRSRGGEIALGAGYRFLAGIGLYSEVGFSFFGGAYDALHPLASLELGLFLDHEVLP